MDDRWKIASRAARLLAALAICLLMIGASPAFSATLRIGYQRYGTLIVLKERGLLESALKPLGWTVEWKLFVGGPQLLEALNAGALDFGIAGEAPPVFAQAAGAPLVYVGVEPPAPQGEAILVPQNSPITSVAQLKGKRVALNRGSNVHYLLVRALEASGLAWTDIRPVYLTPADAPAAFASGDVDAWVIWDPYEAAAQVRLGARILRDAAGLAPNRQYFLASRDLVTHQPAILQTVLREAAATDAWSDNHRHEVAQLLAQSTGLPLNVVQVSVDRLAFGIQPITTAIIQQQQSIADTFARLGLIPHAIRIADAVEKPGL